MSSEFYRRRVLQLYPQLARAVAPVSLGVKKRHQFRTGVIYANYFWADQREGFRLRDANDVSSLLTVRALGYCLYPIRTNDDVMHFDPTVLAQAGDIVLFQHPDGAAPHLFMSKMLVEFGGEYWLAWKDGMFPLGDVRILGVEVALPAIDSSRSAIRTSGAMP